MGKEYIYNKYVRWGQYVFLIFFILVIMFIWAWAIYLSLKSPLPPKFPIWNYLIIKSFFYLFCGIFLWYFFHRLAGVRLLLDEEGILWRYKRKEKRICYEDIEKVRFIPIFITGGWLKIISKNKMIRLSPALKNLSDFMQELKTALDRRGLSDRYIRRNYFKGLRIAVYCEQCYSRFKIYLWVFVLFITVNVIISHILDTLNGNSGTDLLAWMSLLILYVLLPFVIAEIVLWRRTGKHVEESSFRCPKIDPGYEKKVIFWAFLGGEVLYIGLLVLGFFIL